MRLLGIDSATPEASVALIEDGVILGEHGHEVPKRNNPKGGKQPSNHAEVILPLIDTLLARHATSIEHLAGIAVSIGPGSFTGLRIGIATAKGLAYESGIPLLGVSTLLANARRATAGDSLIGSLLDARKGEVYCALFRNRPGGLERLTADALMSVLGVIQLWKSHQQESGLAMQLIGDGARAYETQFLRAFGAAEILGTRLHSTLAAEVARLGAEELHRTNLRAVGTLAPQYLRSAGAALPEKPALTG